MLFADEAIALSQYSRGQEGRAELIKEAEVEMRGDL